MIIDASVEPVPQTAGVLVVGAGPAGIALALELEGHGLDVLVLETGGFERDPVADELSEGESRGISYNVDTSRARVFGGTSAIWTGQVRPLDALDMQARAGVHDRGWPIERSELDPFYDRAGELVEVGREPYDLESWRPALESVDVSIIESDLLTTALFRQSPPTRFGDRYRARLEESADVTVALHATAVELVSRADGSGVIGVDVAVGPTELVRIEPAVVVLAGGTLEVTRLLLASISAGSAGLGGDSGFLGVGFMEHPHVVVGSFAMSDLYVPLSVELFYGLGGRVGDQRLIGFVTLRPEVIIEERLVNFGLKFVELPGDTDRAHADAALDLVRAVDGGPGSLRGLFLQAETRWNTASRVTLSGARDALGMPRLSLDWQLDPRDIDDYVRLLELVGTEVGAAGIGRVHRYARRAGEFAEPVGFHHHMGTTRMSHDPGGGVVDPQCRVHGVENLFVVSGSVFPTSGFANPTLTILALAVRLAQHLRSA